mmetsp:Transcript_15276/g.31522  ORF Transcript_15276/g.31522 Transcript_15276/m.31522 type:complete len:224 (+) Transcript_15276:1188-1859(+)
MSTLQGCQTLLLIVKAHIVERSELVAVSIRGGLLRLLLHHHGRGHAKHGWGTSSRSTSHTRIIHLLQQSSKIHGTARGTWLLWSASLRGRDHASHGLLHLHHAPKHCWIHHGPHKVIRRFRIVGKHTGHHWILRFQHLTEHIGVLFKSLFHHLLDHGVLQHVDGIVHLILCGWNTWLGHSSHHGSKRICGSSATSSSSLRPRIVARSRRDTRKWASRCGIGRR